MLAGPWLRHWQDRSMQVVSGKFLFRVDSVLRRVTAVFLARLDPGRVNLCCEKLSEKEMFNFLCPTPIFFWKQKAVYYNIHLLPSNLFFFKLFSHPHTYTTPRPKEKDKRVGFLVFKQESKAFDTFVGSLESDKADKVPFLPGRIIPERGFAGRKSLKNSVTEKLVPSQQI